MNGSAHPFTLAHYRRILMAARAAGYRFASFLEPPVGGDKRVYLRHDIDNDVGMARRMAAGEAELGVRATYLVMLRSANYIGGAAAVGQFHWAGYGIFYGVG